MRTFFAAVLSVVTVASAWCTGVVAQPPKAKMTTVFERVYTFAKSDTAPNPVGTPTTIPVQPGDEVTFTAGRTAIGLGEEEPPEPDLSARLAGVFQYELRCYVKKKKDTQPYPALPSPDPMEIHLIPLKHFGPQVALPGENAPRQMQEAKLTHVVAKAGNVVILPPWSIPGELILGNRSGATVPQRFVDNFLATKDRCDRARGKAPPTEVVRAPEIDTSGGNVHQFPLHVEVRRLRVNVPGAAPPSK